MTKFTCAFAIIVTTFLAAAPASAKNSWDAFAGGMANGLSGQQLYTPPAQEQYQVQGNPSPQQRIVEIMDYKSGRMITIDRQTGFWFDDRGGSGQINVR